MLDAILTVWNPLAQSSKDFIISVATGALGEIIGGVVGAMGGAVAGKLKQPELALAPFYQRWRKGILHDHPHFHQAFEEFFVKALRNRTPAERNHSLARRAYRAYLLHEFGQQELRGLPVKGARTHIPLGDIFVTPPPPAREGRIPRQPSPQPPPPPTRHHRRTRLWQNHPPPLPRSPIRQP